MFCGSWSRLFFTRLTRCCGVLRAVVCGRRSGHKGRICIEVLELREGGLEELTRDAAAAVGGVNGKVEQLEFAGRETAENSESGDAILGLGDEQVIGKIFVRVPLRGLRRGGLDGGDLGQVRLLARPY
ncbi:MAG TPA: hypothetical protein VHW24_25940 [Bryobacteraceae bacterium]|nr:hypothetical protein [Bryobacteraceae bacterium]